LISLYKNISGLLTRQKLGILATLGRQYPYQSIVAFAAADDMKNILFATKRSTSKYRNVKRRARTSIFIDNRANSEKDFIDTTGMTALGDARELRGASRRSSGKIFLKKHPYLREFLAAPDCALFNIKVRVYYVVMRFQEVFEVRIS